MVSWSRLSSYPLLSHLLTLAIEHAKCRDRDQHWPPPSSITLIRADQLFTPYRLSILPYLSSVRVRRESMEKRERSFIFHLPNRLPPHPFPTEILSLSLGFTPISPIEHLFEHATNYWEGRILWFRFLLQTTLFFNSSKKYNFLETSLGSSFLDHFRSTRKQTCQIAMDDLSLTFLNTLWFPWLERYKAQWRDDSCSRSFHRSTLFLWHLLIAAV